MITLKDKQFFINGKSQIILCGEIHYFRLDKANWQDRITKLKDAGFNAVASYIPWCCHEEVRGKFDLDGHSREELDLISFIDLCQQNDLFFIPRPGPFIMAEMKNEGIPNWVHEDYPELIPTTWDNRTASNPTLDYLAPNFLACVKLWYSKVMPIIANKLYDNGGNVIGVQLDNEIGMLSWVSNCPDLTDFLLNNFVKWLKECYNKETLEKRYSFDLNDFDKFRSPEESYSCFLHKDLGYYMRYRFKEYCKVLKEYSEEFGVKNIPFIINIHGCGFGRAYTYPIGISQLYEAYTQSDEFVSGSDIYLGNLDMRNFTDLYIINGYMEAVNRPNQPLSSLEFECGDGNYGNLHSERFDVSAADFKARMCIAQGHKLINCYLFSGGRNYRFTNTILNDGNDRIAITGGNHGFAAPVGPYGKLNYTYDRLARCMKVLSAVSDKIATMSEERDNIVLGFIPDYYMTEYHYPKSEKEVALVRNLEKHRAGDIWETFGRSVLLLNYRFSSINIQSDFVESNMNNTIVLFSASYMSKEIQERLSKFILNGGKLLLQGEVPIYDMEGNDCTILQETLGITNIKNIPFQERYYLSINTENYLEGFPEVRGYFAQCYDVDNCTTLFREYGTNGVCGFEKNVGKGKVVVIGVDYVCEVEVFKRILNSLGSKNALSHDCEEYGLFMTIAKNKDEKFLHILNLDGFDKNVKINYKDEVLFEGKELLIKSKDGLMLPINLELDNIHIVYSTAEIFERESKQLTFRLTQNEDVIVIKGTNIVAKNDGYKLEEKDGNTYIYSLVNSKIEEYMKVNLI